MPLFVSRLRRNEATRKTEIDPARPLLGYSKSGDTLNSRRLLLVDPDPSLRERLAGLLERPDRRILSVYEGPEAVDRLRGEAFDLLVAGEDRNGFDALKLLRRARSLSPRAPVIVTGGRDPARAAAALRQGAYSYFHHPVPESALNDMVQLALETRSWRDDIRVESAWPEWIALEVRAKLEAVERPTQYVREVEGDLPGGACENVAAAFRELLLNAVEHGAKLDPRKRVGVALTRTARAILVRIHDPGKGFSMNRLPHAAISNPCDSPIHHVEVRAELGQRPGGFGILMCRNLGDELLYSERGNEALFVKYLEEGKTGSPAEKA